MTTSSDRYAAFISYRHRPRDRQWALRIMAALETYRTPKPLQAEAFPARIGHLFRDEDEIPASQDLSDQIKDALLRSDNLIVICSPDTPGSRWVRREIELFQEMGKGDRIFPVLIAGEPEDSFPPELLRRRVSRELPDGSREESWQEVEPIAADVRSRKDESSARTERRALLRLAATLLGCRFDDLARRDEERRRAQWRMRALSAAAVMLVAIGGGLFWWDQNLREKTVYCVAYAESFGVPKCVGEFDAAALHRHWRGYRLTVQGKRVLELGQINSSGKPVADRVGFAVSEPWSDGISTWRYAYAATAAGVESRLANVTMFAPNGNQLRRASYSFSADGREAVAAFDKDLGVAERQISSRTAIGAMGQRAGEEFKHSNVGQHRLKFDVEGRLLSRAFEPVGGGATAADVSGVHGRLYAYGVLGLVTSTRNLDAQGRVLVDRLGGVEIRYDYDAWGNVLKESWHDATGAPNANDQNVAAVRYLLNDAGQIEERRFEDALGHPVLFKSFGVARTNRRYDTRGNLAEEAFFGTDGQSVLRTDIGAARLTWLYDESGNIVDEGYFGLDGKPILGRDNGSARNTRRYDDRGNDIEEINFGTDGRPTLGRLGFSRLAMRYDDRGNRIEDAYFGIDGQPVFRKDFTAARIAWRFDEHGDRLEEAYFGPDSKPALDKEFGVARRTWRYDERGNSVETAYFGVDGKPILRRDVGIARLNMRYDERGNEIEWSYFGIDGQPLVRKVMGFARAVRTFDERGNEIAQSFFGAGGEPILRKDLGFARFTLRYDERGNKIEETYFGLDGRPIRRADTGAARTVFGYDERGNGTGRAMFDTDGKLVARIAFRSDERGNVVEIAYFDADDHLAIGENDIARFINRYDSQGNGVEQSYFGTDGQLTLRSDRGIARIVRRFDERGNVIEESFFGVDGKPILEKNIGCARLVRRYDERNNKAEESYFGIDGEPILGNKAAAVRVVWRYDERDNQMRKDYFDAAGRLTRNDDRDDILIGAGDIEGAFAYEDQKLAELEAAIAVTPDHLDDLIAAVNLHLKRGLIFQSRQQTAKSREDFGEAGRLCLTLAANSLDEPRRTQAARFLGDMSFELLLVSEDNSALQTADAALALMPEQRYVRGNRAYALMFLGRTEEARTALLNPADRGQPIRAGGRQTWEQTIAKDFAEFGKFGRSDPLMNEILQKFSAAAN